LTLLKKFIISDEVNVPALKQMLKQEKENGSRLKEEHSKKIKETIDRIEETNSRL